MKKLSITFQLMRNVGLPVVVVLLTVGGTAYFSAEDEIDEVYDSQMITSANVLWLMNEDEDTTRTEIKVKSKNIGLGELDQKALDEYAKWRAIRLWKHGKLVIYSDNAQPESVPPYPEGFTDIELAGKPWRLFTLNNAEDGIIVEVAEKHKARVEIIKHIMFGLLLPLCVSLPFIALIIWKGIEWGLRDLKRFAAAIHQRNSDDLAKISKDATPQEILPLADSINQLLGKLQTSLAQERLFTDNAAHELRTPLATLAIQADVVLGSKDAAERESAMIELAKGVRRSSRMAEQLLTLARIRQQPMHSTSLNLYAQASEAIKTVYPKASKKRIEISLAGEENLSVLSNSSLLSVLLGNLLDNAVKYTPVGGEIWLNVKSQDSVAVLIIEDTGPGIPESERENVFQRFYRLSDNIEIGTGLGLAIVRSIAELTHLDINFYTPENGEGLGIRLTFSLTQA